MSLQVRSRVGILIAALVGLAFGSIFVGAGFWARSSTQPLDGGVVVTAEVVDVSQGTNSDGDTMYTPIVNYTDPATGESYRLTGSVSSSSRPALGEQKEVSLIPGDPSSARVVGPAWFPWIFIVVGAFVILVTIASAAKALTLPRAARSDDRWSSDDVLPPGESLGTTDGNHSWSITDDEADRPLPAGFHPDPSNGDQLRYWDGDRWTDDVAPQIFDD